MTPDPARESIDGSEPGSGPSAMASEIRETPGRVALLLTDGQAEIADAAAAISTAAPRWATIAGRGTSDHAATFGRYLLETHLGMPTGLAAPSVTSVHNAPMDWHGGLLVAVSRPGEGPDVVAVTEAARAGGAVTVAVTNAVVSPLADAAEFVIDCRSGPERSVAATKTYVAELTALASLVERIRPDPELAAGLDGLPDRLARSIERAERWLASTAIVEEFAAANRALVVSRGYNLATALEIALKLKETSGLFAEGYSTADLQHGPVVLAAADAPSLAIRPPGDMGARVDDVVARLAANGRVPWSIDAGASTGGRVLGLELDLPDTLSPAAFVLPGQILAEAVARRRGLDPDAPRSLTKITLTS
jgi:glutamine---fructose-6-phosphate transaminase (isomerizing)